MTNTANFALAFDFGGTKLAASLINTATGTISNLIRLPAPAEQGADACFQAMVKTGSTILDSCAIPREEIKGIGISFGGIISDDGKSVVKSMHVKNWNNFPLPEKISSLFNLPTYMENDGNAAAIGEWIFGAGKGVSDMLYIQISTGVGSGLILSNRLFKGQGMAGEFGHMTVEPDGPLCACGKYGCVETLTSGWAFSKYGTEAYQNAEMDSPLYRLGNNNLGKIDAQLLFEACREGDIQAVKIVERGIDAVGLGLRYVVELIDPQLIVLGGGVTRSWDVMYPLIIKATQKYLSPLFQQRVKLVHSFFDGTETLLGAAMLTTMNLNNN